MKKELDNILLDVQKPGRYVGGELGQVIKDEKLQCGLPLLFLTHMR